MLNHSSIIPRRARIQVIAMTLAAFVILLFLVASCTKEGPTGPQGPPGGDDLTNPSIKPKVIFTYPGNNSLGPYDDLFRYGYGYNKPHFVLRFNKLVSTLTFDRKYISVRGFDRPATAILFTEYYPIRVARKESSVFDAVLAFSIVDSVESYNRLSFKIGETYTVTIDSALEDVNGNKLQERYQFSFTAEPYFRVIESYPKNGDNDVRPYNEIALRFNSVVDTSIFSFLHLIPPIAEASWRINQYDPTNVYLQYWPPLPFNTAFTLSVAAGAHDKYGHALNQAFTASFSVPGFKVISTYPLDGATNVNFNYFVQVSFNSEIDTETVRSAMTISPPMVGNHDMSSYSFKFIPANGFAPNTMYTVTLDTSLHAKDGSPLSARKSFSFTTQNFNVEYTNPSDGSSDVGIWTAIFLQFNSKIDTGSVRGSFSIIPHINGSYDLTNNQSFGYIPNLPLSANTIYTVTINTGLKTITGVHLPTPYTFAFKTGAN